MHDQMQYHEMNIYIKARQQQLMHEAKQQQLVREAIVNTEHGSRILRPVLAQAGEILIALGHQLQSRYSSPVTLSRPMTEPCVEARC